MEDQAEIAEVLQIILEQNGCQVIVLGDHGDEPFDELTAACPEDPDLIAGSAL